MLNRIGRFLDDALLAVFPETGARRLAVRRALDLSAKRAEQLSQGWDAAERDHARGKNWMASGLSPDALLEEDLETLRNRSRDFARSNEWASSAIESRVTNVVGTGLTPQAKIPKHAQAKVYAEELHEAFDAWSPHCSSDAGDFYELCGLIERSVAQDGECFILLSATPLNAESPLPLRLQLIAPERVQTPPEKAGDPRVRLGIEKDRTGKPIAAYVQRTHPEDPAENDQKFDRIPFVDANGNPRLFHLFDRLFVGQSRGVPWMAPIMGLLKDLHDFTEAELIGNQVAACFAAFIETDAGSAHSVAVASSSSTDGNGRRFQSVNPGQVTYLNKGEKATFSSPTRPSGTFAGYMEWQMLGVAAGLNWPFAWLIKDYRRASFSSGRLGEIDGGCHVRRRQASLASQFLQPLWRHFVRMAILVGEVSIDPSEFANKPRVFNRSAWVPPGRPWIDPQKQANAAKIAIESGLSTQTKELNSLGEDFDDWIAERSAELQKLKAAGIVLGPPADPAPADPATNQNVDPDDEEIDDDEEISPNKQPEEVPA